MKSRLLAGSMLIGTMACALAQPSFLAASLIVTLGGAAYADSVTVRAWDPAEDRTARDNIVTVAPIDPTIFHQTITPGSLIPEAVPLKLFPASAPTKLQGYAYFVSADHKVVVVEADTRQVVRILGEDDN